MSSSDSWMIDIGERSYPNPMYCKCSAGRCHRTCTPNRFGWSFFFTVSGRCARSRLHMNGVDVVLVQSQESCALVRIVRLQKFDRRANMLFTVWLTRTHHWNSPRSKLAFKKPTSTRKMRKFPVTSGQGWKHHDWTVSR